MISSITKTLQKTLLIAATTLCCALVTNTSFAFTLDYGLYWFNANNNDVKGVAEDNSVYPVDSSYYDPSKKTVIYFHGWQNNSSTDNYRREDFYFDEMGSNTVQAWKDDGWNVGVFYWNQFADEGEVKDAEAKIWSANGPKAMRYRLSDGSYVNSGITKDLGTIAYEQIKAALSGNTSNIRFAGHSLGNQLATRTAKMFHSSFPSLMPDRLELLDPFWSAGAKSYISNKWTGEQVRNDIRDMISSDGLAVTWYKTSAILDLWIGDRNNSLESDVAYIHPAFWYLNSTQIADKHVHARHWYFASMDTAPPEEVTINWLNWRSQTGNTTASASATDARIKQMMGDTYEWVQVEGRYTPEPSDDQYERKNY